MNKNKPKPALIVAISLITIFLIAVAITTYWIYFTVHVPPRKLKAMKAYYSDDSNYSSVQGTVEKFDEEYIWFSEAIDEDNNHYLKSIYRVFAPNAEMIMMSLDLHEGDVLYVLLATKTFWHSYKYPIVSIKKDGVEYLSFEDGKAALLEWVNNLK